MPISLVLAFQIVGVRAELKVMLKSTSILEFGGKVEFIWKNYLIAMIKKIGFYLRQKCRKESFLPNYPDDIFSWIASIRASQRQIQVQTNWLASRGL